MLPDVNVRVYAHREDAPRHPQCRRWLEGMLNSDGTFWIVGVGAKWIY
jgi:hypothetical protein